MSVPEQTTKSSRPILFDVGALLLLVVFIGLYLTGYYVKQLELFRIWPDILAYVWLNVSLGTFWWNRRGAMVAREQLTLGQQTLGTTIQAGIVATSIFIPLSLTAIQIIVGNNYASIPANVKLPVANLIVAVFWFGVSTVFGVTALVYVNQRIGENRDILQERLIGIPVNLQYYAIVMGTLRVLYVMFLMWVGLGLGFY